MTAAPSGSAQAVATPAPRAVQMAFWTFVAAAALNAVLGLLLLTQVDAARRTLASAQPGGLPPSAVGIVIAVIAAISLIYAAAIVLLALRLRAGAGWARTALFIVSLLSLIAIAGSGLGVVALLVIANVLAFRRPVSLWLRERAGLNPA